MGKVLRWWQGLSRLPQFLLGLVAILVGIIGLMGFNVITPNDNFRAVNNRITEVDTRLSARIDTIAYQHDMQDIIITNNTSLLESLAIGECLQRTPQEISMMRLPCDRLLHGAP